MSDNKDFIFTNSTLKAVFLDAAALRDKDTASTLPEIIHAKGFSMEMAVDVANRILVGVNNFDRHFSEITEGRKVVSAKFAKLDLQDQLTLAKNIRVIRAAMDDENVQEELQDGVSLDRLSNELFGDTEGMTDDEIRAFVDETLEKTDELGLSRRAANRMLNAIKKNRKVLSVMRSIAVRDYDLKVCTALEIYLSTSGNVSVEDATSMACSSVELQRVADDLSRGIITAEAARGIILGIGLAFSFYMLDVVMINGVIAMAAPEFELILLLLSLLALLGVMSGTDMLSKNIPLWVGWLSVKAPDIVCQVVDGTVWVGDKVAEAGRKVVEAGHKVENAIEDAFAGLKNRQKTENTVNNKGFTRKTTVENDEMNEVETDLG